MNTDGKQSGSGFCGLVLCFLGSLSFLVTMYGYLKQLPNTLEVMGKILIILSLSAALLGVRKFVGSKNDVKIGDDKGDRSDDSDDHRYFDDSDSGQIVDAENQLFLKRFNS